MKSKTPTSAPITEWAGAGTATTTMTGPENRKADDVNQYHTHIIAVAQVVARVVSRLAHAVAQMRLFFWGLMSASHAVTRLKQNRDSARVPFPAFD